MDGRNSLRSAVHSLRSPTSGWSTEQLEADGAGEGLTRGAAGAEAEGPGMVAGGGDGEFRGGGERDIRGVYTELVKTRVDGRGLKSAQFRASMREALPREACQTSVSTPAKWRFEQ
jgi:hypothetical protein